MIRPSTLILARLLSGCTILSNSKPLVCLEMVGRYFANISPSPTAITSAAISALRAGFAGISQLSMSLTNISTYVSMLRRLGSFWWTAVRFWHR